MCLIIHKQANTNFNRADIADFYTYNQDGIGLMYMDSTLQIYKTVPTSLKDVYETFRMIDNKEAIIHLRMRTHGDIDHDNTHPYQVLNKLKHGKDLFLVHNGILPNVANDKPAMSDTWHYIRDTLTPLLSLQPALLNSKPFQTMLGQSIGSSNKLVFMDDTGKITTINKFIGTTYKGCWLSNTYAWSSPVYNNSYKTLSYNTFKPYDDIQNYSDEVLYDYNKKDILDMSYTELYEYAESDLDNFIEDVYSLSCTI